MKKILLAVALISNIAMVSGCANNGPNENVGIATGAIAGGLLGSTIGGGSGRAVATGVGAVGGALIGGSIGRNMDEQQGYYGY